MRGDEQQQAHQQQRSFDFREERPRRARRARDITERASDQEVAPAEAVDDHHRQYREHQHGKANNHRLQQR